MLFYSGKVTILAHNSVKQQIIINLAFKKTTLLKTIYLKYINIKGH